MQLQAWIKKFESSTGQTEVLIAQTSSVSSGFGTTVSMVVTGTEGH